VCSTSDASLGSLIEAIDELAADSEAGTAPAHLAQRIAALWGMIADLDPELARRRPGYERPPEG
jgi:hypothetical protein